VTKAATFSALRAGQRAEAVLDAGTFAPVAGVRGRVPFVVGSGFLAGAPVLIALTDGHVRGGTIGVREATLLARLAETANTGRVGGRRPVALILGFDTGGVRVEEGPRALAAASGVGVALARLTALGIRVAAVISGPRGCFGALSVMAALPERIIITAGAHWGLTGPQLLRDLHTTAQKNADGFAATSALTRLENGDAHAVVADHPEAVRTQLCDFIARVQASRDGRSIEQRIAASYEIAAALRERLRGSGVRHANRHAPARRTPRQRDLLKYSFRGNWRPSGPRHRRGLVHAGTGFLGETPALTLIVGPEPGRGRGVGIDEASLITDMLRLVTDQSPEQRAAIVTFLFCHGHAVDIAQERFGLHRALAECLRAVVAARLRGHPIITVLGGATYGAAYLALAAPSHRILALRGTSVAPMAPQVLRAFQALRGHKPGHEAERQLADLIPEVRVVESVIRLPRVLMEELALLVATVKPEPGIA
jgi:malonate decarboxylase beta subunit